MVITSREPWNKWREARREEPFMPRKSLDRRYNPRRVSSGIARGNVVLNIPPGLPNGECLFLVFLLVVVGTKF